VRKAHFTKKKKKNKTFKSITEGNTEKGRVLDQYNCHIPDRVPNVLQIYEP